MTIIIVCFITIITLNGTYRKTYGQVNYFFKLLTHFNTRNLGTTCFTCYSNLFYVKKSLKVFIVLLYTHSNSLKKTWPDCATRHFDMVVELATDGQ